MRTTADELKEAVYVYAAATTNYGNMKLSHTAWLVERATIDAAIDALAQRAEAAERRVAELEPLAELGRLVEAMPKGSSLRVPRTGVPVFTTPNGVEYWGNTTADEALRAALGEAAQPEQPEAA